MYVNDTIAAISTPLGEGGIGVIRISGDKAGTIGAAIFRRLPDGGFDSHRFYYGSIIEPESGNSLDEVLIVLMKAPRSYTREDVLEIHCHGGYLLVQRILSLVLRRGARLADPGEFTRRAFLNGRIDLVQAEAVIDVIRGKTDTALSLAQRQREGLLSRRIAEIREDIVRALAFTEAHIDFPEEDMDAASFGEVSKNVVAALEKCGGILDGYEEGKALREGVSVVIAGKPNVGKSSLLNTLLREKRAIVTAIPGTTRDVIEEVVNIRGLPVKLLDTAGICETEDPVEKEGVRRATEKIQHSDLVIFVLDASMPVGRDDLFIAELLSGKRVILVLNKSDLTEEIILPEGMAGIETIRISAKNGAGIESLHKAVCDSFLHGRAIDSREFTVLSNTRQKNAIDRCRISLQQCAETCAEEIQHLDLLAADIRQALNAIGEVTGETTADDLLDMIFQRFCIGK